MDIQFDAFKTVVAKQIAQYNLALNGFKDALKTFSDGVDQRFKKLERLPCMKIETIFNEKEVKKLLKLI